MKTKKQDINYWRDKRKLYDKGSISIQEYGSLIINSLEGWIKKIATTKYGTHPQHYEDLCQEARLTVWEHILSYDPLRGIKPLTFFHEYIDGAMYKYMSENSRGVSKDALALNQKIKKAEQKLRDQGIEPTHRNIARWLDMTVEQIYRNVNLVNRASSQVRLDRPSIDEGKTNLIDTLSSETYNPEKAYEEREKSEVITKAIIKLPSTEQQVALMCLANGVTYKDASEVLSIPVAEVKRIKTSAAARLKASPILRKYMGIGDEELQYNTISFRDEEPRNKDFFGSGTTVIINL